jgi:hypothetical protein
MLNPSFTQHDERALSLIDTFLRNGSFPREAVAEISYALAQAQRADRDQQRPYVPRESRR